MISFDRIDLNLLSLMIEIHDKGSVSRAGRKLGLSQPASSNALARLRHSLGDPLFVRGKDGMVPTALAERIVPHIRTHLAGISAALAEASEFDPATSTRTFRLSLSGLGEQTFLPPLARRVFADAPNVRLENVSSSLADLPGVLSDRDADVAIGILDLKDKAVCETHLFDEVYRAVGTPARPQASAEALELKNKRIILVAPSATYAEDLEWVLAKHGLSDNICVRLRHFGALPDMLGALDAVAIVPGQFATRLAQAGKGTILPAVLPLGRHGVKLVWHQRTTSDPGCAWLRGLICELFRQGGRAQPS